MPASSRDPIHLNKHGKPPRRRPAQGRSRATVAAILEAAARILRHGGEAALTTAAVAERAGVSIGSLYAYFDGREAILLALADQLLDSDEAAMDRALAAPGDPVRNLVTALVTVHLTDRELRRVVLARHLRLGHGAAHMARAGAVAETIARQLPASFSADRLRFFIVTRAVLGACRALTHEDDPPEAGAAIEELVTLIGAYLETSSRRLPLAAQAGGH